MNTILLVYTLCHTFYCETHTVPLYNVSYMTCLSHGQRAIIETMPENRKLTHWRCEFNDNARVEKQS